MDKLNALRNKHPQFIYDSFQIVKNKDSFTIIYKFILEPNITFLPQITIPLSSNINLKNINNLAFHLGLIEMISYWKSSCSPQIIIKAGSLTPEQISWWKNEMINGLGEFFYVNQIDFTTNNFLNITSDSTQVFKNLEMTSSNIGNLILTSGGKDTVVTLNLLPKNPKDNLLMLNPTESALNIALQSGFNHPIIIKRELDPLLLRMNNEGYLNGHTPFSAYLAFLGLLVGFINNFRYVIASNEQSANEGNTKYRNLVINHQYSKSYQFEINFRNYAGKFIVKNPEYFSFLRPLSEIQITAIFAKYPQYFTKFVSCNKLGGKFWCRKCAKCAFVYVSLYSFLNEENMLQIFKEDLFQKPQIQAEIQKLLGLTGHKPFDCVGTKDETIYAIALIIKRNKSKNLPLPLFIKELQEKLKLDEQKMSSILENNLLQRFNSKHFLPNNYAQILQNEVKNL